MGCKINKICDICGDKQSVQYRMWHSDDDYNGMVLCSKHYTQLRNHGKIKDKHPSSHLAVKNRICDVCGSNYHVIYHEGKHYCLRHYSQIKNLGGLKEKTIFDKNDYIIDGNIAYIILRNDKHEEVGRAIIDIEDLERILQHKWRLGTWDYADTKINHKTVLMQRFILNEFDKNKIPDHINKNTLDNRKCNLRISNKAQNAWNSSMNSNNTSGVKGVSWFKAAKLWRAYLTKNGERFEFGYFKNKDDAIKARLIGEREHFGEFAPQKHLFKQYGIEV